MYKTIVGLVVKRTRFKDSHAYIKALTKDGVVDFAAFGVMSPKNKNFSSCQPYTLSEFVLTQKGESLTLSQGSTVKHLIKQGIDFEGLSLANYISRMAGDTALTPEDSEKVFSITCSALKTLMEGSAPLDIIKAVFEFKLTSYLGFEPELSHCSVCGCQFIGGVFRISEGSVVCEKCNLDSDSYSIQVSPSLCQALKKLVESDDRQAFGIRFTDPALQNTFSILAERFSLEFLDIATDALKFYKENIENF